MAERPRMTPAQLADKLLASEHDDVVSASAAWMVAQLMEAEVTAQIGAKLGQRTPDRVAQRSGYRPRPGTPGPLRWSCGSQAADRQLLPLVPGAAPAG